MKKSDRPTIILIHGFRGTRHGLRLIAENLSNHPTLVPDLPGFGNGDTLSSYSLDSYVRWLHRFIRKQQLQQPPILLGHSFGSIICAAYTTKYPKTIAKLILVNPIGAPALEGPRQILTQLGIFYYWISGKMPRRIAHAWLAAKPVTLIISLAMTKTKDKTLRRFIYNEHFEHFSDFHSAKSVAEAFKASISHNIRDFAANISVPTLLIAGDRDDITPLTKQHELARLFPNAVLQVIHNVGHLTHYETPDQITTHIQEFVS